MLVLALLVALWLLGLQLLVRVWSSCYCLLALLVALWLLGLQLVVTSRSWRLIKFFMYCVWIKGGLMANDLVFFWCGLITDFLDRLSVRYLILASGKNKKPAAKPRKKRS
jgi:hypothetical protein